MVRKLLVEVGTDNPAGDVVVKLAGEAVAATSVRDGRTVRIDLERDVMVNRGDVLEARLR